MKLELHAQEMQARGLREDLRNAEQSDGKSKSEVDLVHATVQRLQRQLAAARDRERKQELMLKVSQGVVCGCEWHRCEDFHPHVSYLWRDQTRGEEHAIAFPRARGLRER